MATRTVGQLKDKIKEVERTKDMLWRSLGMLRTPGERAGL